MTAPAARRLLPAVLALAAAPAVAQTPHWQVGGPYAANTFGVDVSVAGDVDGDGIDDVIVGDLDATPVVFHEGQARVLSGVNGSTLHIFNGWSALQGFGASVDGIGDLDGDGHADLAVASLDFEVPVLYSGATGAWLYSVSSLAATPPSVVAGVGDLNGDGFGDVALGAPDANGQDGRVWVLSGRYVVQGVGAEFLHTLQGTHAGGRMGAALAPAGDVNGDGRPDFLVGSPDETEIFPVAYCGAARVLSGVTGNALRTVHHTGGQCERFGYSLASLGDVNGDGRPEFAVGAAFDSLKGNLAGAVRVYDGANGALLRTHYGGDASDQFGRGVAGAGDVSGDGVGDLLVGAPGDEVAGPGGAVWLYSGATGALLSFFGVAGGAFGSAVAGGGDFDGDGYADFVASAPNLGSNGTVYAYTGQCSGANVSYCVGAPNSYSASGATLTASGSLSVAAQSLTLLARQCPPGQFGMFFYGPSATQLPLGNGFRCVDGQLFRLLPAVPVDALGIASMKVDFTQPPVSAGPGMITGGDTWYFQFWYRDPAAGGAGHNLTDARALTFCP